MLVGYHCNITKLTANKTGIPVDERTVSKESWSQCSESGLYWGQAPGTAGLGALHIFAPPPFLAKSQNGGVDLPGRVC